MRPSVLALGFGLSLLAAPAFAQHDDGHGHAAPLQVAPAEPNVVQEAAGEHDHAAHDAHGAHGDDHAPTFEDFNWYYGLIAEREGAEPGLLFRPKGMPVPFLGLLFDSLILYWLLYRMLGKSVRDGLKRRKEGILRGMEDAAKMRREAEAQLQHYEEKLAGVENDVARLRSEMRDAAAAESARILSEAKEQRTRMERDARILVEQELKAVREELAAEIVRGALRSAEKSLRQQIGDAEQQRFAEEYLSGLGASAAVLRGRA